ncbi:MAG: hypothetical protein AB1896_04705 [Thermodesulfobacteriota bacterium]
MKKLLTRNLALLEQSQPAAAELVRTATPPESAVVFKARNGDWTMAVRGVSLHSRFAPREEAEAEAALVAAEARGRGRRPAVFGLGLGYHVIRLTQDFDRVLVIEPDPGTIRLAMSYLDFREALPRLLFVLDRNPEIETGKYLLVRHPPTARLYHQEYQYWRAFFGAEAGPAGPGPKAGSTTENLAEAVRARRGPLAAAEVYILLIEELARNRAV